jgi:formylmethanofuran dehydrogenase subunit E
MMKAIICHTIFLAAVFLSTPLHAETKEEWIALGARVHGAFGPFIPVGIRIGLDAVERLKAEPRSLTVTFYNGSKPPCPCVADGIMLATHTSPGQGTLLMAAETAPAGSMASVVIRNKKTGEGLRYTISDEWLPKILSWIRADASSRYDSAMNADGLFTVEAAKVTAGH